MPIDSLQAAIMGFGLVIALISLTGVFLPAQLLRAARAAWRYRGAMVVAVTLRLAIGLLLILAAPASRFPHAFAALGWIAVAAALLLPLAGRRCIDRLLDWWARRPALAVRLWSLAGVAFGGFLLYGAAP